MSDCEWMFADCAMGAIGFNMYAHFNPFRWSGAISFEKAICELEEVQIKGSRPILVRVPAGVSTTSLRCETTESAISYLKKKDPAELERKRTAAISASKALKAASAAKDTAEADFAAARAEAIAKERSLMQAKNSSNAAIDTTPANMATPDMDCEWMFGDVGLGMMGFRSAKLNPLRWSGKISIQDGISQLCDVQAQECGNRDIVVKVPGGLTGNEQHFNNSGEAIAYLEGVCPVRTRARTLETFKADQEIVSARINDAEADAAKAHEKLVSATATSVRAEASLEFAMIRAERTKADLDEHVAEERGNINSFESG